LFRIELKNNNAVIYCEIHRLLKHCWKVSFSTFELGNSPTKKRRSLDKPEKLGKIL